MVYEPSKPVVAEYPPLSAVIFAPAKLAPVTSSATIPTMIPFCAIVGVGMGEGGGVGVGLGSKVVVVVLLVVVVVVVLVIVVVVVSGG